METGTGVTEQDLAAAIIQGLDEPAILLDETESITHLNEAAAAILGVECGQVIGRAFESCDDRLGYAPIRAAFEKAGTLPAGQQQSELSLYLQGFEHRFLLRLAPLRMSDGRLSGTLIVLHDITELREQRRARNGAIAAAAHELNTPLTSIALGLGLLQRNAEKQQELTRLVLEDVDRMRHASLDFLGIVEEQPRSIPVRRVNFDLARIVTFVKRKFAPWAERKNIKFTVHSDPGLHMSGDPPKLSWVLAALVSNALRFTREAGTIALLAERTDEQVKVSICDNGPGIPAQVRELVVRHKTPQPADVFESAAPGLGLALAKEILEAHGGRLFAENSKSGSTVTITLPLS
jgi:two-component system, NtrC family, sensor histidine kinase KinB